MPSHPYWSGSIRISLVGFSVQLFTATRRSSQVPLHEYDKKTGERIRHLNVNDDGDPVEDSNIIKGFEPTKGEFVPIEKSEIEGLKIESSDVLDLATFVTSGSIPVIHYERPYYVLPAKKGDEEIYGVLRQALIDTDKIGIGQIALRGREELCALLPFGSGLILETLRYPSELQDIDDAFDALGSKKAKADHVTLARQLIDKNSADADFSTYHDRYHEALLALIDDKKHQRKPKTVKMAAKPTKVIDFADALRKSLAQSSKSKTKPVTTSSRKRA